MAANAILLRGGHVYTYLILLFYLICYGFFIAYRLYFLAFICSTKLLYSHYPDRHASDCILLVSYNYSSLPIVKSLATFCSYDLLAIFL